MRAGRQRNWLQARRGPTTLLDPIEEPFDPVTGAVEIRPEADRIVAIDFRRDIGPCAFLHALCVALRLRAPIPRTLRHAEHLSNDETIANGRYANDPNRSW